MIGTYRPVGTVALGRCEAQEGKGSNSSGETHCGNLSMRVVLTERSPGMPTFYSLERRERRHFSPHTREINPLWPTISNLKRSWSYFYECDRTIDAH